MNTRTQMVFALSLLAVGLGSPASSTAAATQATYYLSLGDSIAGSAQPIGGESHGYSEVVYKALRANHQHLQLVKLRCGGETTTSMLDTTLAGFCRYPGNQLDVATEFIAAHPGEIELITITIGGNDVLACLDPTTFLFDQGCLDDTVPTALANLATIAAAHDRRRWHA